MLEVPEEGEVTYAQQMGFEKIIIPPEESPPRPAKHTCELPGIFLWNRLSTGQVIGRGSIWSCDECSQRWEFDRSPYKTPVTSIFWFVLTVGTINLIRSPRWKRESNELRTYGEWGLVLLPPVISVMLGG